MNSYRPILKIDASCEEVQQLLPRFIADASSIAVGERGTIIQHLADCSDCRVVYSKTIPAKKTKGDE